MVVIQAILTSEKIHDIVPMNANAVLILGQGMPILTPFAFYRSKVRAWYSRMSAYLLFLSTVLWHVYLILAITDFIPIFFLSWSYKFFLDATKVLIFFFSVPVINNSILLKIIIFQLLNWANIHLGWLCVSKNLWDYFPCIPLFLIAFPVLSFYFSPFPDKTWYLGSFFR